jgi:hypothetical protein
MPPGPDALIIQEENTWQVQINLREPNRNPGTLTGYLVPTMDGAKSLADKEVRSEIWPHLQRSVSGLAAGLTAFTDSKSATVNSRQ